MSQTENQPVRRPPPRQEAIETFVDQYADCADKDLLAEMMVTVCRLARDGTDRGDLKLLSKAFKELRYAFKVFAPHRETRKVSIFGSARTPPDHPDYLQADRFARRMRQANWMVITGAGDGIMRAGHDGAGAEASFGVAIPLPFEQQTNDVLADADLHAMQAQHVGVGGGLDHIFGDAASLGPLSRDREDRDDPFLRTVASVNEVGARLARIEDRCVFAQEQVAVESLVAQ